MLVHYIQDLAIKSNLPILVRAYAGSAAVHTKMGYTTLARWETTDQRPESFASYTSYIQQWSSNSNASSEKNWKALDVI